MKRGGLILHLAAAGPALLICIGTMSFFGPCVHEDGGFGPCHDAGVWACVLGGVLAAAALAGLLPAVRRSFGLSFGLDILACALAVVIFLVPGVLCRLCMMDTMRCVSVMKPAVRILSAAAGLLSLVSAGIHLRERSAA